MLTLACLLTYDHVCGRYCFFKSRQGMLHKNWMLQNSALCESAQSLNLCCGIQCRVRSALCESAQSMNLRCVSQHRVRICALWVSTEAESALCESARSLNLCCVSQHGVWICSVWVSTESSESALCESAHSLNPRSFNRVVSNFDDDLFFRCLKCITLMKMHRTSLLLSSVQYTAK